MFTNRILWIFNAFSHELNYAEKDTQKSFSLEGAGRANDTVLEFAVWHLHSKRGREKTLKTKKILLSVLTFETLEKVHTSSTSFSRKGTNFRSSLSFLSTNQLSIGMPLESWNMVKLLPTVYRHRLLNLFKKITVSVLLDRQRLGASCQ